MSIKQRVRDWLREREIGRLSWCELEAISADDWAKAEHFRVARYQAIRERSPGQIVRMEVRKGLRPRQTIKRGVMAAYVRHWVPAALVTLVFRVFRLGRL